MDHKNVRKIAGLVTGFIFIIGCKSHVISPAAERHQQVPVSITAFRKGQMQTYVDLKATSQFLYKAVIKAPVTGYLDEVRVNQGETVEKDQVLFTIKTREASVIRGDSLNGLKFNGIVNVKAATRGVLLSVIHSKGDYVAEGDELCQIALNESLVFIMDVPFELRSSVKLDSPCDIILADSSSIRGIIKSRLSSMTANSQTVRFIIKCAGSAVLPENLWGRIRVIRESVKEAISLPKSAVLADETLEHYWVMKLMNDSMAVKVPVSIGIITPDYVQITGPEFNVTDKFLVSGNYGLGDTVFVKILSTLKNGQ